MEDSEHFMAVGLYAKINIISNYEGNGFPEREGQWILREDGDLCVKLQRLGVSSIKQLGSQMESG